MRLTLLRRAEPYSSPKTLGMGLRIPITNFSYSGLCRPLGWTDSSVTLAIRPAYRQSSSLGSKSMILPANMRRNLDNHALHYELIGISFGEALWQGLSSSASSFGDYFLPCRKVQAVPQSCSFHPSRADTGANVGPPCKGFRRSRIARIGTCTFLRLCQPARSQAS